MNRTRLMTVLVLGSVLLLTGCSTSAAQEPARKIGSSEDVFRTKSPDFVAAAVCIEESTLVRVEDDECADKGKGVRWWFVIPGDTVPAVGAGVDDGSAVAPEGPIMYGGVPTSGGVLVDSNGRILKEGKATGTTKPGSQG